MDAGVAARRWVDAWTRGWSAHDPAPIVALYADDAVFSSHPFREPGYGPEAVREYVSAVFADEEAVEFGFHEPVVGGDDRAAVEWWAHVTEGGRVQTLAGVTVLRFDSRGQVLEHRDYWALEDGRRPV